MLVLSCALSVQHVYYSHRPSFSSSSSRPLYKGTDTGKLFVYMWIIQGNYGCMFAVHTLFFPPLPTATQGSLSPHPALLHKGSHPSPSPSLTQGEPSLIIPQSHTRGAITPVSNKHQSLPTLLVSFPPHLHLRQFIKSCSLSPPTHT